MTAWSSVADSAPEFTATVEAIFVQRDPRFALHSGSPAIDPGDPSTWPGDARLSGLAVEVTDADTVRWLTAACTGSSGSAPAGAHGPSPKPPLGRR